MNHTPFILAAYAVGLVVLSWCAMAPLLRQRRVRHDIRQYHAALRRRTAVDNREPSR